MLIGVQVLPSHHNGLQRLTLLGNLDLPGRILHGNPLPQAIALLHRPWNVHRAACHRVQKTPEGICPGRIPSLLIHHKKITISQKSLQIIRLCPRDHLFTKAGIAVHHNLPCGEHPHQMLFPQILHPQAQILGLKGGAVLKIVDKGSYGKLPLTVSLAVSDPAFKCIHL